MQRRRIFYALISLVLVVIWIAKGCPRATLFGATYFLDMPLYFYYLKNSHLNKWIPRAVMTTLRITLLLS